jgi:hypothetical protein
MSSKIPPGASPLPVNSDQHITQRPAADGATTAKTDSVFKKKRPKERPPALAIPNKVDMDIKRISVACRDCLAKFTSESSKGDAHKRFNQLLDELSKLPKKYPAMLPPLRKEIQELHDQFQKDAQESDAGPLGSMQ